MADFKLCFLYVKVWAGKIPTLSSGLACHIKDQYIANFVHNNKFRLFLSTSYKASCVLHCLFRNAGSWKRLCFLESCTQRATYRPWRHCVPLEYVTVSPPPPHSLHVSHFVPLLDDGLLVTSLLLLDSGCALTKPVCCWLIQGDPGQRHHFLMDGVQSHHHSKWQVCRYSLLVSLGWKCVRLHLHGDVVLHT